MSIWQINLFSFHNNYENENNWEGDKKICPLQSHNIAAENRQAIAEVSWLPNDNGLIITSHKQGKVHLWESQSLQIVDTINLNCELQGHAMSPSLSIMHSNLAISSVDSIALVDLRTGSALHTLSTTQSKPTTLVWDSMNEFCLYGGLDNGGILKWDIRKPQGKPLFVKMPIKDRVSGIVQLDLLGQDFLMSVSRDGFICMIRPGSKEIIWQSELEFTCLDNFKATLVQDTVDSLVLLPFFDTIIAYNLYDGCKEWQKPCLGFRADGLLYNHERSV